MTATHALALVLLVAPVLSGQAGSRPASQSRPTLPRSSIDPIVLPFIVARKAPGVVVGVLSHGSVQTFGYGKTASDGKTVDGDTIFEIGSVTKVFTGALLALMVEQGEVSLATTVARLLPPKTDVPVRGGKEITLLDLATQSSGLPRLPPDFRPGDPLDPYAGYTVEKLYASLAEIRLTRDIGSTYEYSNLGVGLLGHALALRAGKSYEQVVRDRICTPLGMRDTAIEIPSDRKARLAPGHGAGNRPAKSWQLASLVAAGGLKSTANDLLRFLSACLSGGDSALARSLASSRRVRREFEKGQPALGLCWHCSPLGQNGQLMFWHNGGTGGYRSFVALVEEPAAGVVVLGNSTESVDALGVDILRALAR